jgi:6-phosphogluconolactonase (cycloisomerase 2 family)
MIMSHTTRWNLSRLAIVVALGFMLSAVALAQVNAVYVVSNIGQVPNANSILAFSNDGTGKLTPITGSPFKTTGTGVFNSNSIMSPAFQADQEVVVNSAGTLLLAVNGDSDTISSFAINSNGRLKLLSTTPSGGQDPVSIGLDENSPAGAQVTVINQAADPNQTGGIPNVTSFVLDESTGVLTAVANSTINFPTGSLPSQALVSPSGKFVFTVQFMGGGLFSSYNVGSDGLFTLNNSMLPTGGVFLGAGAHPKQRALYVGEPNKSEMLVYTYNTAGFLARVRLVVVPGSLVCWFETNKAGTRLYTNSSGTNQITVFDISGANFLKPLQLQSLTTLPGGEATNIKLDPLEQFLYVLGSQPSSTTPGNFLHVLNVSSADGTLTETQTPIKLAVHTGEVPEGLAVVMK